MQLAGTCLTFSTEDLYESLLMHVLVYLGRTRTLGVTYSGLGDDAHKVKGRADSNWAVTRSITGCHVNLAGAAIGHASRRQHCISMSSCEAELVALAELAIELLYLLSLLRFIGHDVTDAPVVCETDNKGAFDLCHRFTSAQNSRHIDRKLFKMRELRGAGAVDVRHVSTDLNSADLFTKILGRQVFERHRKVVLNTPAGTIVDSSKSGAAGGDGTP